MDFTQNILLLSSILCSRQLCLELAHLLFPVVTPIQLDSTFNHVFFSLVKRSKLTHNKLWSYVHGPVPGSLLKKVSGTLVAGGFQTPFSTGCQVPIVLGAGHA